MLSDERSTLLEIKKNIDTSSPKIILQNNDKLTNIHDASNETYNKTKVMKDNASSNHSKVIKLRDQSNTDIKIKKSSYDYLGMLHNKYLLNMLLEKFRLYFLYLVII